MWRMGTFKNMVMALINNPDWLVMFIEMCGVLYFFHLIHLAHLKVKRAGNTVKLIIVLFVLSVIVYVCWNYLYIDGVNPFTHAIQPVYYA